MRRVRGPFGIGGAGLAVTFSLLAHAGFALIAARQLGVATLHPALASSAIEIPAPDIVVATDNDATEASQRAVVAPPAPNTTREVRVAHAAVAALAAAPGIQNDAPALPEPPVVSAAPSFSGPRFALTVAPTIGNASSANSPGSSTSSTAPALKLAPIPSSNAEVPARLQVGNVPSYTAAALSAGVEANVPLEIVVSETGAVTSARGLDHVGYGLDEVARQSVLSYRFSPALRAGKAIAVRMQWLMRFQLR
ncbi:MAG: energy transducer TonB [Polyangiaceae bacterium]